MSENGVRMLNRRQDSDTKRDAAANKRQNDNSLRGGTRTGYYAPPFGRRCVVSIFLVSEAYDKVIQKRFPSKK